jgi:hypothetical protein
VIHREPGPPQITGHHLGDRRIVIDDQHREDTTSV